MKYKKFVIDIILYIILYHVIFENLVDYYDFDETDNKVYTPFGRILRKYIIHQNDIFRTFYKFDFLILFINLFISSIYFYIVNRYYGKENIIKTIVRLIVTFIIINIIIIGYTFIDNRLAIIFVYVVYILIPMFFMVILLLPLLWLIRKLQRKIPKLN